MSGFGDKSSDRKKFPKDALSCRTETQPVMRRGSRNSGHRNVGRVRSDTRFGIHARVHQQGGIREYCFDSIKSGFCLKAEIDTAFNSCVLTGVVLNSNYIQPHNFLQDAETIVLEHVRDALKKHQNRKVNTVFNSEFVTGDKHASKSINTRNCELFGTSDPQEWYERYIIEPTLASLEEFQERDSGWALTRILNLTVNVNKYNPLRAGCHIKLPRELLLKKATITVQSSDNACFAWAVVAALHSAQRDTACPSSYPDYASILNLQGIEFPLSLKQIGKFERLNEISINVYSSEMEVKKGPTVFPLRLTSRKRDRHVNLLYTPNQEHGDV
ncbi:uncharacterized protein LOC143367215 [Andrena cerasifolii]|uniref:uncharacterized protein LOC143367215 n=1 Tax=Andrena cerasifolii TaxID=2819439 RepID=UPI0040376CE6